MKSDLELYKKVEKFVQASFEGKQGIQHFERTVHWIKVLKPGAEEALLIAAIAHDIERSQRAEGGIQTQRIKSSGMTDKTFLRHH